MFSSVSILGILFCIFLLIKVIILKPSPSDTPAGAIVMACGIFINGPMRNIKPLEDNLGKIFTIILLLLWMFIWASFGNTIINNNFKELHLKNPIKSFAIGTWVAGTSVTGIAVYQRISEISFISYFLFAILVGIWIFYVWVFIRNYGIIFREKLHNKVHGVLLLTTVSTQSLVLLANTILKVTYLMAVSRFLIFLGGVLYVLAFILIIKRYFFTGSWNVEDDWQNTNCIIHGAMSITGLASVVSGAVNYSLIFIIWIWVVAWFIIIEVIEIIRGVKRIRKYGFNDGIAIYDVTQWSRIFTFGMFYTFTMRFDPNYMLSVSNVLFNIQSFILRYGTWVMSFILIIQGVLFLKGQSKLFVNTKE